MTAQPIYYPLSGGLDQESPAIAVPPGRCIAVLNHEAFSRGYQRTQGFERFDGQPRPSEATYSVVTFTDGEIEFEVGDVITGLTSGATATVLAAPVLTAGSWVGDDAEGRMALHLITGVFVTGESLQVGGMTYAVCDAPPIEGDGTEDAENLAYMVAAREYRRALIQPVPGSGAVRGVVWYDGKLSAWRDNVGATAGILHHSTAAGWDAPDLGTLLRYSGGGVSEIVDDETVVYEIEAGDTITGTSSGATATVRTIVTDAGTDWATSDAAGTMVLDDVVGVFEDGERLDTATTELIATVEGVLIAPTFPAGGRYEFDIFNFYGTVGFERAYGANGVGQAFEYDGDSIIPISTGMPDDRPFLVAAHKNHLFLGFPQGSLQHSDLGEPRSFTAVLGAAELGMGHELTGIIPNASATLLITTETSLAVLTGNDSSDWLLETLNEDAGAKRFSQQRIGQIVYLDERGVRSVSSTQTWGNFRVGTYTSLIQRELEAKRKNGATVAGSCVVKGKDQYLLFFSDGTGISIYFGRKNPEPMLFEYPFVVSAGPWVAEVDGFERVFVGATDGYVYELNMGTSFDGEEIEAFIQFPFGHQGAPRLLKRYHKAILEMIAGPDTSLAVVAQFDYGGAYQPYAHSEVFGIDGGGGLWGISSWAEFQWDSPTTAQAEAYLQGAGVNMSLVAFSASATMDSYALQGVTIMFSQRGQKR
jgi:hypothetical protein